MAEEFDVLIKNAEIVDGTGNPGYRSDLAVRSGRIERIEPDIPAERAGQVIDAEGRVAAPGFIDTHTHDDFLVVLKPTADEKVLQGVTTLVLGNCGISLGPLTNGHEMFIRGMLGALGGNLAGDEVMNITRLGDYLDLVASLEPGVNVAPLLGHVNLRFSVLGMEQRPPTAGELDEMKALAAGAMEDGAFGLSTGLIYAPGNYADTEELIALAEVAAAHGGVYTTHLRSEGEHIMAAMAEAVRIGEEAGLPVHISHHKLAGRPNWGGSVETLNLMTRARSRGVPTTCDQYPYTAGSTFMTALLPPRCLAQGPDQLGDSLKDPAFRAGVIEELESGGDGTWENLLRGAGFENVMMSMASHHTDLIGMSIADIAKQWDKPEYDTLFDLLIKEKSHAGIVIFSMSEDDVVRIMKSPFTMIGSDGIPGFGKNKTHPRLTGTFPRVLGRYVREKMVVGLEEAVRKMTSLPAATFGLKKKGLLVQGYDADLVVFDPLTVIDQSTYEEPDQPPLGISLVLVGGRIAVEDGAITGRAAGEVLRRG